MLSNSDRTIQIDFNELEFILIALNALKVIEIPGNSHLTPDIRSKWEFRVPKLGNVTDERTYFMTMPLAR
jgi:hypothetical protein